MKFEVGEKVRLKGGPRKVAEINGICHDMWGIKFYILEWQLGAYRERSISKIIIKPDYFNYE